MARCKHHPDTLYKFWRRHDDLKCHLWYQALGVNKDIFRKAKATALTSSDVFFLQFAMALDIVV